MSVHSLIASPLAKGLFQRAIVQSGGSSIGGGGITLRSQTLADVEANGVKFAEAKGAASLAALRAMTWQKIVEPLPAPPAGSAGTPAVPALRFSTIVDGYMLPLSVREAVAQGKHNDVPVLTGANLGELGGLSGPGAPVTASSFVERARRQYGPMADEFLKLYPAATDAAAAAAQAESSRDQSMVSMYLVGARAGEDVEDRSLHLPVGPHAPRARRRPLRRVPHLRGSLRAEHAVHVGPAVHRERSGDCRHDVELLGQLRGERQPERQGTAGVGARGCRSGGDGGGRQDGRRTPWHAMQPAWPSSRSSSSSRQRDEPRGRYVPRL